MDRSHSFFFFNDTATTEIYTLSLHDALPISEHDRRNQRRQVERAHRREHPSKEAEIRLRDVVEEALEDRKSTRLNSSHGYISYAVFCLKKKKNDNTHELDSQAYNRLVKYDTD